MNFTDFAFIERIQQTLAEGAYATPTPIQSQAIPLALEGRDILGIAQTGTGKTAAFSLPSLNRLAVKKLGTGRNQCRMLVLAPTRELAKQIADSMAGYGKGLGLYVTTAFGGVPIGRQKRALAKGVDILVATPGRLLDLYEQRSLDLSMVEILVLDEADQMLDLGFAVPLKRIVTLLPRQRQSLFFSATMPATIADLADRYLSNPAKVEVAPAATTVERVDQMAFFVEPNDKARLVAQLVRTADDLDRVLVFTRTKHAADRLVKTLDDMGLDSVAIHGNKSQPQREKALNAFRRGGVSILIATDIAARGIDVDGVTHVINYELPNVPDQYVHRIGRTARAGRSGLAVALVAPEEKSWWRAIQKLIRMQVPFTDLPQGFDMPRIDELPPPQMGRGGPPPKRHAPRPVGAGRPQGQGRPQGAGRPQGDRHDNRGGHNAGYGDNRGRSADGPRGPRADAPRADAPRNAAPRSDGPRHEGPRPAGGQGRPGGGPGRPGGGQGRPGGGQGRPGGNSPPRRAPAGN